MQARWCLNPYHHHLRCLCSFLKSAVTIKVTSLGGLYADVTTEWLTGSLAALAKIRPARN